MKAEDFVVRVEKLITEARESGKSDEDIIADLEGIVDALKENA
jgi:hypothetical protein